MKREFKYFHKLPQKIINRLLKTNLSWGDIVNKYKQPSWCNYPNALEGKMGCWSLTDLNNNGLRTKISKKFCKNCPCYITK